MALSPFVAQAIMGQQAPDIIGSFQRGREMKAQAQERERVQTGRALQSQLLSGQFTEGSDLARLAKVAPETLQATMQALNIPADQNGRLVEFAKQTQNAVETARTDPMRAVQSIIEYKTRLNTSGIETPKIDEFILNVQQNPSGAFAGLAQLNDHFTNIGLVDETQAQKDARELETFKRQEEEKLANTLEQKRQESVLRQREKQGEEVRAEAQKQRELEAEQKREEQERLRKEAAANEIEQLKAEGKTEEAKSKVAAELRKTRSALTKDFRSVEDSYRRIQSVGDKATPASDLALVFNYMKLLDPGSVVRESEFKTAEGAKAWLEKKEEEGYSVPGFVSDSIRKATEGTILRPEQREDFMGRAADLFDSAQRSIDDQIDRDIVQIASAEGVNLSKVLGEREYQAFQKRREPKEEVSNLPEGVTPELFNQLKESYPDMTDEELLDVISEQ